MPDINYSCNFTQKKNFKVPPESFFFLELGRTSYKKLFTKLQVNIVL